MASPILNLTEMAVSQSGKYLTHNFDNRILEAFSLNIVQSNTSTVPDHSDGLVWLVGTGSGGEWVGQDDNFAISVNGSWEYATPTAWFIIYNKDTDSYNQWSGTSWLERPTTKGNIVNDLGTSTATTDIDYDSGISQTLELGINTTLTFSNVPSYPVELTLIVTQGASAYTLDFPASVLWEGGTSPVISVGVSAVDVLKFYSNDGGVTFYGTIVGQDFS